MSQHKDSVGRPAEAAKQPLLVADYQRKSHPSQSPVKRSTKSAGTARAGGYMQGRKTSKQHMQFVKKIVELTSKSREELDANAFLKQNLVEIAQQRDLSQSRGFSGTSTF